MRKIICITTYPPRECGIATFAQDLIRAILSKFGESYSIKICAVESDTEKQTCTGDVEYVLDTSDISAYATLTRQLNENSEVKMVLVQHEFGLYAAQEEAFLQMLQQLLKPVILVFHTVLAQPSPALYRSVGRMMATCANLVVMTQNSREILLRDYQADGDKIAVIPHGTHLVSFRDKSKLKDFYQLSGRRVLSTFGLLSPGKSIETTLDALPAIVKTNPSVIFLIIGKTHPGVLKVEGEKYRNLLEAKIKELHLEEHVLFINQYLELPVLLEYLQLTDVYLFTSSDPNQAVSGTFVYALSCGCPIIATPIPHALELLSDDSGIIFDFKNSEQLSEAANHLLADEKLRTQMKLVGLQKTAATAWENVAIAYASLFQKTGRVEEELIYSLPPIDTYHIRRMSRQWGIIQFSKGNRPDSSTGYTLDDTARALMAMCQVVATGQGKVKERYVKTYLNFIRYCQQPDGSFLNYVDKDGIFTSQNEEVGLDDSNGRAVCALGYFISCAGHFPAPWKEEAEAILKRTFQRFDRIESPRSIAFMLKGFYYYSRECPSAQTDACIWLLANKLAQIYRRTAEVHWRWFEAYLTYDNAILPEAMLLAHLAIGREEYKEIARESFEFLLKKVFVGNRIQVVSNQGWMHKGKSSHGFGEQPVDVAGMVIALKTFYQVFKDEKYLRMQKDAFNWFLGNNHLHQIVYNPATGGCYDGLEENNINLNQGAESTVCYLMARLSLLSD
ncbi:glycosyltransferase [Bacteroides ovatus]|jgi:putative mannosyltransferase|uniref:Glycosyltransferase involved in cell wall bisynthesis n=1 Tax=Bacteroides ovatus TaxID=28116 RepID=A0A1G6G909_BACOV|nr:glycosyltransferase [Bacteroides ovatus]MDC2384413.1 glycosyltransferase [Bacteroides ovatus]SDB78468.1 Glycosyltransferase involved in cell wall bisynthesis [Bacteroides ovatus]